MDVVYSRTEEERNLICALLHALKLCCSTSPVKQESVPTIIDKLDDLATDFSLNISLEKMIPLLLKQEPHHNYVVIDSFDIGIQTQDGFHFIWSFRRPEEILMGAYEAWLDFLVERSWPLSVTKMLEEFSKHSLQICYDGYVIVELRNIQYTGDTDVDSIIDSLNESDKSQIISKFLLVKVESETEKEQRRKDRDQLFYDKFLCLDPDLSNIHFESSFYKQNKSSNIPTQGLPAEVANFLKTSSKAILISKGTYSICLMTIFLAIRNYLSEEENEESKMDSELNFIETQDEDLRAFPGASSQQVSSAQAASEDEPFREETYKVMTSKTELSEDDTSIVELLGDILSKAKPSEAQTSKAVTSVVKPSEDESSVVELSEDESSVVELSEDETSEVQLLEDETSEVQLLKDETSKAEPSENKTSEAETSVVKLSEDETSEVQLLEDETSEAEPSQNETSEDETSEVQPSEDEFSKEEAFKDEPLKENYKYKTVETFGFKYFCGSENQNTVFKKRITVEKTLAGHFRIAEDRDPTCPLKKTFIEVEEEHDVDRIIHKVYHKCLNECSSQITVFHKFNTGSFKKIFHLAFEKPPKQREENPEGSLIQVSYIDVPKKGSESKELVPRETDKSRYLNLEGVHGWFEAKEKYNIQLTTGIEQLGRNRKKGRRNVLLGFSSHKNVRKEINRLKRMAENESQWNNKKRRTEEKNASSGNIIFTATQGVMEFIPNSLYEDISDDENPCEYIDDNGDLNT